MRPPGSAHPQLMQPSEPIAPGGAVPHEVIDGGSSTQRFGDALPSSPAGITQPRPNAQAPSPQGVGPWQRTPLQSGSAPESCQRCPTQAIAGPGSQHRSPHDAPSFSQFWPRAVIAFAGQ